MAWDASFAGDAGGWGGDASFATERKDNKATQLGDRLPVPARITDLNDRLDSQTDRYTLGIYNFATAITVGIIKSISNDNGTITYVLHDPDDADKDFVAVKYSEGEDAGVSEFIEGTRVKAIGKIKRFDDTIILMLFNICEMENDKDYRIFTLEARAAQLFFEKNVIDMIRCGKSGSFSGMLAPPTRRGEQSSQGSQNSQASTNRLYNTDVKKVEGGGSLLDRVRQFMLDSIPDNDEIGLHIDDICQRMGSLTREEILPIMEKLVEDGFVYSTTDEYQFSRI